MRIRQTACMRRLHIDAKDDLILRLAHRDKPVQAGVGSALFGGIALQGDVVSLLQSLTDEGELAVRLAARAGSSSEGYFSLDGLKVVRNKLAPACKWPLTDMKPRN